MPENIMAASGGPLLHIDSAGAALITGSIAVDVQVADYISIVGSPAASASSGSIWVTTSATTILNPRADRLTFCVSPGSVSSNNNNATAWFDLGASAAVNRGMGLVLNQIWGISRYTGSVTAITDAGSMLVGWVDV